MCYNPLLWTNDQVTRWTMQSSYETGYEALPPPRTHSCQHGDKVIMPSANQTTGHIDVISYNPCPATQLECEESLGNRL
jgi:hypothetical protein